MTLITRISRLFRADANAVLDRIEEPGVLLRQAVREMEQSLADDEQRLRRLTHAQQLQTSRLTEIEQSLGELAGQLDTCFRSDRDDLARALIRRRLECEQFHRLAAARRDGLAHQVAALDQRVAANRQRLMAMRQKAEALVEEDDGTPDGQWPAPGVVVRDEDVEVVLLQEKQRRAQP
jgi:phage shock protein A